MSTSEHVIERLRQELKQALANPGEIFGFTDYGPGWPMLNHLTGGLQRLELVVVVARPGVGKSMWIASLVPWLAMQAEAAGKVLRIITLEMTKESYLRRVAAMMAEVKDPLNIQRGMLSLEEQIRYEDALEDLSHMPIEFLSPDDDMDKETAIYVPGASGVGFNDVLNFLKPDDTYVWFLDHIGLLKEVSGNNTVGTIYDSINRMLWLAHSKVGGLVVTHLSRATVGKRATASGVSNSDQIGKNADKIFAIQRPWYEADKLSDAETTMLRNWKGDPGLLTISKNRSGVGGQIPLWWNDEYAMFTEWSLPDGKKIPLPGQEERRNRSR